MATKHQPFTRKAQDAIVITQVVARIPLSETGNEHPVKVAFAEVGEHFARNDNDASLVFDYYDAHFEVNLTRTSPPVDEEVEY